MSGDLFHQTSCIVLSAGNSQRMGEHKALLKFSEKTTFIEHITDTYLQAGLNQVIVVVSKELHLCLEESGIYLPDRVSLIINPKPELGRFYSLQTGLNHIKTGNSCFFQNIDNPFATETLLRELIIHKDEAHVIMPTFQARAGHPVLISPWVVQESSSATDYEVRIDEFLKQFHEKRIEIPDNRILTNINSPEDYFKEGFVG